jgi:hypothetical protein
MKRKIIKLTLTLNDQTVYFTAEGDNQLQASGLAISCNLAYGGGAITPTAQITVHGLAIEQMNKLLRVQWNTMQALMNTVRIEVGNQGEELSIAYEGNITQATIGANSAPDIPLVITSQMAMVHKLKLRDPYVLDKDITQDGALIIEMLANEMGYTFENNGAYKIITDVTLEGSPMEMIQKVADICDFDLYVDQKSIAICKAKQPRQLKIPIISPSTGMIGYPEPDIKGVSFSCFYDPTVKFGGIVTIKDSIIQVCNADWRLYGLTAQLEANIPNGKWQMDCQATWRESTDAAISR